MTLPVPGSSTQPMEERDMAVAKVIEILAEGTSIEAAVEDAVAEAGKTVDNIRGVYVQDIQGVVEDGSLVRYRVNCKITFVVGG
jgi:flavin-binding protein dodecin